MKKVLTLMLALVLSFSLAACKKDEVVDTSAADLADAVQKLSVDVSDALAVTSDITLPSTGLHDSVVTWSSNNTAAISNTGVVTRPEIGEGNATVILTATVKIGELSSTKDFTLKVLEKVPSVDVTIAEFNSSAVAVDDVVVVTGVIFGFVPGKGIQISDGTGFVYVYGTVPDTLVLGDKVAVSGSKTIYFGLPEVDTVTNVELISSGNTLPTYEATSTVALFDEDPYDTMYWSKPINVSGMVKLDGDDNVVIVTTDEDGMSYDIVVYYSSDEAKLTELTGLVGKVVTADVIVYGFHDGLNAWRVTVASNAVITSADPTDAQLAAYEAGQISLGNLAEVMDDLSLNTSGMMTGTTIAWASDNEAVISTAGVVNRVAGADTTVVLTATVTVGTETFTRDFTAVVTDADANLVTITVAEAMALDDDTEVVVKAIVAGFNYANRVFFQDADGTGIYLHATVEGIAVGDEVIVRATMSSYNDIRQFKDLTLVSVVSSGNDVFVNTTATAAEVGDSTAIATTQNRLYKLTLTVSTLEDGSYTLYTGNGTSFFSSYTSGSYLRDILVEGDTITYTFFVTGLNGTDIKMEIIDTELTAAQNLAAVQSMIEVSGDVTADLELKTELADFDATITWASDNAAVTAAGVVTRPAAGEADLTVTLTASVVIGTDAAVDYTFDVVVKALEEVVTDPFVPVGTELFISEYIEGSSNNKAIEIFNPTGASIDLSTYSIVEIFGTDAEDSNTLVLTGTIASGGVFVICTDQLDSTLYSGTCNMELGYPSVVHYNGDDAVQLLKDTTVIDEINNPANAGDGNKVLGEVTLVRVATVVGGNTTYTAAEWTEYAQNMFDYLGSHTCTGPAVD